MGNCVEIYIDIMERKTDDMADYIIRATAAEGQIRRLPRRRESWWNMQEQPITPAGGNGSPWTAFDSGRDDGSDDEGRK